MPDDPKPEGAQQPDSPAGNAGSPPPPTPSGETQAPASSAAPKPPAEAKATPPAAGAKPAPPKPAAKPPAPKAPVGPVYGPWEGDLADALREEFGERIVEFLSFQKQNFLVAKAEAAIPIIAWLKSRFAFDYMVDLTAVHWPQREEQFDVVYILYSFERNERVRIKIRIHDGENVPTATEIHPSANWMEREVYDMFGIQFDGHPDLKRILLPDEWQGYPLRKDYGILQMDKQWVQQNVGIESGQ